MPRYLVTAKHQVPQYSCNHLTVEPRLSPGSGPTSWYVYIPGYGVSKDYPSPESSIRNMLLDHGCYDIEILEIQES